MSAAPEVVADSTVLIFLGKLRRLESLRRTYSTVLVPERVKKEVVDRGKELGAKDAVLVEAAIDDGWIEVITVEPSPEVERYELEAGESEVLTLALERDHDEVLVDEEGAREVARLSGLGPRGTLWFLVRELERGSLDFDGFLDLLDRLLDEGFYLSEEVYIEAVRRARQIERDRDDSRTG